MAKHLSGRQNRLNVGITSFTETQTVVQVTGKVAIGATDAAGYSLYVNGPTNIIGPTGFGTISSSNLFSNSGIITNLAGTNLNYSGIGTVNNFISTTANITNLSGNNLKFNSGIITTLQGTNIFYNGIGTIGSFIATNAFIQTLNAGAVRSNSGIITTLQGTNIFYNGIGTIGSFIATNSFIQTLDSNIIRSNSGIITNITGTNLNYSGISTFTTAQGPLFVGSATSTGTVGQTLQVVGINSGVFIGGNLGIGSVVPTSKLSVQGDVLVSGIITSTTGGFRGQLTGVSNYTYIAGFSSVTGQAGVATISAVAGFATVASIAGYSSVTGTAGFSSFTSVAGFATVSSVAGFATVSTQAGVSTIASVAGFSTFASTSGFSTVSIQAGISTSVIGGIGSLATLQVSGISTFVAGPVLIGSGASTGTATQPLQILSGGAYVSGNVGIGSTLPPSKLSVVGNVSISGVVTANNFFGPLTGIAASATQLVTPRNFSIVGSFVTATSITFDGTGNVSLAATVVPDSIGLGTYTSGDYVRYITGTTNEITVTNGLGEGSTPQISLPNNVSITNNLNVGNDLFVGGNVTIGGSSFLLNVTELRVEDKDIILGFTTLSSPTDASANHAGIAIASTEGVGLVPLQAVGLNTLPESYKQLMWLRSGSWAGLATDAFLFNYGVGIGSTQIPYGVRLAVGNIQMTDSIISGITTVSANFVSANTLNSNNQQNTGVTTSIGGFRGQLTGAANYAYLAGVSTYAYTSGFSTVASVAGFATVASVAGFASISNVAGVATFSTLAGSAGFATVSTQAGIATSVIGGVVNVNSLTVSGLSTLTSISAGGTTGTNQYVLTSTGTGLSWQAVTGIGAITGINIAPDTTNAPFYIPFVKISTGTTATEYADSNLTYNPGNQRLGIGTSNPGSTLDVMGTLYVRDYITSPTFYGNFVGVTSGVTFYAYNAGVSTISSVSGFSTVASISGFSTVAAVAGFATVASVSGFATLATYAYSSGFSTYATAAGFSTISTVSGFSTQSAVSGFATVSSVAGFATVASVAGFATVSTFAGVSTFANISNVAGFSTFASTSGFATVSTQAGIATSVIGGVVNVNSLNVSGVSTLGFVTGTSAFFTGIVTAVDGRLISGIGIQSGGVAIGAGVTTLNFIGLGNTFLLRGSTIDISIQGGGGGGGSLSISTSVVSQFQYLSFVSSASTSILGISTLAQPLGFTPSNGNLGIGTSVPTSRLTVFGDTYTTGVTSSIGGFSGQLTGVSNYTYIAGFSTFAGNVGYATYAGLSGFATVSNQAGISSYSLFANLAGASGFATVASVAGFSSFASISGFATVSAVAGFSTYASTSGFATVSTQAGISTSVIGGVVNVSALQVSGISSFSIGAVIIGTGQTTGITSTVLQLVGVTSSAYIGGNVGIGTTDLSYRLNVNGDINSSGVIRVNGRNILDDAVIFAIALG
jgi:hypothetical protein